jgi:drug/metabolite transporter (DMT)-like permease
VPRRAITLAFLVVGVALAVVSYFFLSAPLGNDSVENSNPRMQFAPALLVIGVILAFGSAVVYELLPDGTDRAPGDDTGS